MFQVNLYSITDDDTTVPKNLGQVYSYTGECRDELDVLNPVFVFQSNEHNVIKTLNYCYIPTLNRYYYCKIEFITNDLYRVTCHADVLQSFWNQIKNVPVVVERSRNLYNSFIVDGNRKFYQYSRTQYVKIGEDIGKPTTPILITVG